MISFKQLFYESAYDDLYTETAERYIAGDKTKRRFLNKLLYKRAQKMGYNILAWHGVHVGLVRYSIDKGAKNFTEFETVRKQTDFKTKETKDYISGSWFSNNPKYVRSIGSREEPRKFILNIQKPFDTRVLGKYPKANELIQFYKKNNVNVKNLGHSYESDEGVIMHDEPYYSTNKAIIDAGFDSYILYEDDSTSFVIYNPEQIKLFDITFNDNSQIIPLSERFNSTVKDFRY